MSKSGFKKGQAAMEFLMTYGWAILVVLVAIGALAYFGVLSPDNLLPEKCTMPVQLRCSDYRVLDSSADITCTGTPIDACANITLILQNAAGRPMLIRSMNATSDTLTTTCGLGQEQLGMMMQNGQRVAFELRNGSAGDHCGYTSTRRAKDRFDIDVVYSFGDSPNINHELAGELLVAAP